MLLDKFLQAEYGDADAKELGICFLCGAEIYGIYYLTPDGYMLHPFCAGEWGRRQFESTSAFGEICPVCQMPVEEYEEALENFDGDVIHYECVDKWAQNHLIYVSGYAER